MISLLIEIKPVKENMHRNNGGGTGILGTYLYLSSSNIKLNSGLMREPTIQQSSLYNSITFKNKLVDSSTLFPGPCGCMFSIVHLKKKLG